MKNNILLGSGIITVLAGIAGLFVADKKNNKVISTISGIIAILGLLVTAKVLDEELYPEDYDEDETFEEEVSVEA